MDNIFQIVKIESGVNYSDEYEDEIQQINELCQEIDKLSRIIHELRIEIDSMRILILQKDKQLKQQQIIEQENFNLKIKYNLLADEMHEAREYMLNLIENLDEN